MKAIIIPATKTLNNNPLSCVMVNKNKKDKVVVSYTSKNILNYQPIFTYSCQGLIDKTGLFSDFEEPAISGEGVAVWKYPSVDAGFPQNTIVKVPFSYSSPQGEITTSSTTFYFRVVTEGELWEKTDLLPAKFKKRHNSSNALYYRDAPFTQNNVNVFGINGLNGETLAAAGNVHVYLSEVTPYKISGEICFFMYYTNFTNNNASVGWYSYAQRKITIYIHLLSSKNIKITSGEGNKTFTLEANEFVTVDEAANIAQNIYNEYKNGKQAIYGDIIFGDYKLSDGTTSHNHRFRAGDIVEPYTASLKPYGRNLKDGTPKRFVLDTVELRYDNGTLYWHIRGEELVKL